MAFDANAGLLLDAASGLLFVGLGAYVALHRPRNEVTLLVAAFCMLLGTAIALRNLAIMYGGDRSWFFQAALAAGVPGAAALIVLLLRFPSPASRRELAAAVVLGVPLIVDVATGNLYLNGVRPATASFAFAAAFVGVRAGLAAAGSRERRVMILMTAALVLFPALAAGRQLHALATGPPALALLPIVMLIALASVIWTTHMIRWASEDAVGARVVVWLALLCVLLGLTVSAFLPQYANIGVPGLLRTTSVLVLAYAILRQQFLGADVTARFAISKSTLAAVFIAVFFIASEAAQQFFGETFGSAYVGIIAAGALVFAIAPLSRVADRLAERAVPVAGKADVPAPGAGPSQLEVAFKAAVRAAMKDGSISRREERHLAEIVRALGIDPLHAHDWRDDVQREPAPGAEEVAR